MDVKSRVCEKFFLSYDAARFCGPCTEVWMESCAAVMEKLALLQLPQKEEGDSQDLVIAVFLSM